MNEDTNSRRGFIRGLTLVTGFLFLGTARRSFGASNHTIPNRKNKRVDAVAVHCAEGEYLPLRERDPALIDRVVG
jgi:hypothetical protein